MRKINMIHAAERLAGLERVNKQFTYVHDLAKRTQNAAFAKMSGSDVTPESLDKDTIGDQEMAISLGDTFNIEQPAPAPNQAPPRAAASNLAKPLMGLAAAALLGPVAGVALNSYLNKPTTPPPAVTDSDTDTRTIIRPDTMP